MLNNGLMTIEDLSGYLKVRRRTIYDWLKHNKIPALKLVGQWRFKKEQIDAWVEGFTHFQIPAENRFSCPRGKKPAVACHKGRNRRGH